MAKYEQRIQAYDSQISNLAEEKNRNSGSDFTFSQADQQRLLHLTKEINRINLESAEKSANLDQLKSHLENQRALLQNGYLKK